MNFMKKADHAALGLGLVLALCGCVAGPDFQHPQDPLTKAFAPANPTTASTDGAGGAAQRFVGEKDVPQEWWSLFGSDALDRLVRQALDRSPTIEQARARLVQAREAWNAQAGATQYPAVDAGLSAKRQHVNPEAMGLSGVKNPSPYNLYNASVSVSYGFDVFGKNKRILEGLEAGVDHRAFELEAARETLTANVVVGVIQRAALTLRLEVLNDLLNLQETQLAILEAQFNDGGVSVLDRENQRLLLSQTAALIPPLENQAARISNQLAVYLGMSPVQAEIAAFNLNDLHLPDELPLDLPSELLRRRPDIRAAEALWHQACAGVGVATADLYPSVTISGSLGSQQTEAADILNSLNVWSLGANLMQPVFRGGELKAKKRAATAVYDESAAVYKSTVLKGFQEVADALHALESDARLLKVRSESVAQARTVHEIASRQFETGSISRLALLKAQQQQVQAQLDRIQAQADRYADSVALLHALGGGWWRNGTAADDRK